MPAEGAVQLYQTDAPPGMPMMSGSPGSLLARKLSPVTKPVGPAITWALSKLLLAGCAHPTLAAKLSHAVTASGVIPSQLRTKIFFRNLCIKQLQNVLEQPKKPHDR